PRDGAVSRDRLRVPARRRGPRPFPRGPALHRGGLGRPHGPREGAPRSAPGGRRGLLRSRPPERRVRSRLEGLRPDRPLLRHRQGPGADEGAVPTQRTSRVRETLTPYNARFPMNSTQKNRGRSALERFTEEPKRFGAYRMALG